MKNLHLGENIKQRMIELDMQPRVLADMIGMSRANLYYVFRKPSLHTDILFSMSKALNYNFFADIAAEINQQITNDTGTNGSTGLIPMSNNMVQKAASSTNGVCVDDNGNAVCEIYKITENYIKERIG